MTILRIRWRQLGGHIHCRVFTGHSFTGTFEKCGDVVFDERGWLDVVNMLQVATVDVNGAGCVQLKHEDEL